MLLVGLLIRNFWSIINFVLVTIFWSMMRVEVKQIELNYIHVIRQRGEEINLVDILCH